MSLTETRKLIEIKIHAYGPVKDYFEGSFFLKMNAGSTIADLFSELKRIKPFSADILNSCRAAVCDEFSDASHVLKDKEEIFLLPPASGG